MAILRTLALAAAAFAAFAGLATTEACDTQTIPYQVPDALRECYNIRPENATVYTNIQACAYNRNRAEGNPTGVSIYYAGPVVTWDQQGTDAKIRVWFKLNGRESTFDMTRGCGRGGCSASIFLPFDSTCKADLYGLWFYAFDGSKVNNWDVEFAIVSVSDNKWDNNNNKNYKFTFNKQ